MTPSADALPTVYRFADITLDTARRRLARQGKPIELKALDFDLLQFLVESAPHVVNADVLAEKVWGRHFVSPENVAQRVMLLRQSLSDDANRPRYVETVRNKGYRLIPAVARVSEKTRRTRLHRWAFPALGAALLVAIGVSAAAAYWRNGTAARPAPNPSSVAVLPFENLSPDAEYAYFAVGMQDEIVSQLTKISGLRVFVVRPGSGAEASISGVARDLNVATALGGSVHYSEGRVRVTPRLTHASTGVTIWSDSYERELREIFAIQAEVALDVARRLRLELSAAERQRIERVPTTSPRARDLYLRAIARYSRDTPNELLVAIGEAEQALALDPAFVEAWVVVAAMRTQAQVYDPQNAQEHRARGQLAARRALELDPALGSAHAALGMTLTLKRDWKGAEAAFRRARNLNVPVSAVGMGNNGILQLAVGNFASAREFLERFRSAEPQNPTIHRFLMFAHAGLGDWAAATELYESGMRLFKPWREGPNQRMHWLVGRNELAEASAIPTDDPFTAAVLANLDDRSEALVQIRHAYAAAGAGNPSLLRNIGLWAGHFGEPALALDAMRAAVDEQGAQMVYVWLPQLAPMRRLPEFKAYMRDIGMVAYWQEYGWPALCRPLGQHDFECE